MKPGISLPVRLCLAALISALSACCTPAAFAGRVWWDGSHDDADAPPGKLLSGNDGYWGESVLTGVEYRYESEPTNPADVWKNEADTFGRRLLDGRPSGNWWVPVGVNYQPLVVTLDFKRRCTFGEVDISTRSKKVAIRIEAGDGEDGPWRLLIERSREDCPERMFHRLALPPDSAGRYLRLSIEAEGITYVEEVLVWGDAEVSDDALEAIDPVVEPPEQTEIAFASITGIEKTAFSDAQFWDWRRQLGADADAPAVWSLVSTWDSITDHPILPARADTVRSVAVPTARNETECLALALTNTSCEDPRTLRVSLGPFSGRRGRRAERVAGSLRVAGAIGSRHYGVNLGPLFEADNLLDDGLMQRFLTNGAGIARFPAVTLPPAGSAVLWLTIATRDAKPGRYAARLECEGSPPITVTAEVLDVTLPSPPVWLNTWSGVTSMFPFTEDDRPEREVAHKQSLGVTVWRGLPEKGSVQALARERGRTIHYVYGLPTDYVHRGYANQIKPDDLTDEDAQAISEHVRSLAAKTQGLGMTYDEWFVELWDEPGEANSLLYGALAKIIREADPNVRIYCNPCFWVGGGVLDDENVYAVLSPWYREYVDVSAPLYLLLRDRPQCLALFDAPRSVRAFYTVATQSAKSEAAAQVELYRRQAWDAFKRGWNGWGFYSYYAPRGNPWTDFDRSWTEDRPDYQMVYPGPRGPIPTRQSEAVREGWEDYCLLTLLRDGGRRKLVDTLLDAYERGEPMSALRLRALRAAAHQ